ncbi:hypothetical protein [Bacillus sp. C1]
MESLPHFPENVSCQLLSIPKNTEPKIKNSVQKELIAQVAKIEKFITSKPTTSNINKTQESKSNIPFPLQINIPYFNIHLDSTELLGIAKSVLIETLLKKVQDPEFLMNILNSEGGNKLLSLVGNLFNTNNQKPEENADEK